MTITVTLVRSCLLLSTMAAAAAAPCGALAQASATATASVQIIEPVGIGVAASGGSALPAGAAPGVAQVSGEAFKIQGPANQVVSVSTSLPPRVERVGGGAALPLKPLGTEPSAGLTAEGAANFAVNGTAPARNAPKGLYAGTAVVVVNLN